VDNQNGPGAADVGTELLDGDLRDRSRSVGPALDAFLHPRAIAVVGASSDPGTLSGLLFANLVDSRRRVRGQRPRGPRARRGR
jgi:hypothetical protein